MGYQSPSKGIVEVAEIGVKVTRAREVVDAEETEVVKRRKIGEDELKLSSPVAPLEPVVPVVPVEPVSPVMLQPEDDDGGFVTPEKLVSTVRLNHAYAQAQLCRCSRNATSEHTKESLKLADLQENGVDTAACKCKSGRADGGQKTQWKLSVKLASAVPPGEVNNRPRSTPQKPSAVVFDAFFAATEQKQLDEFTEKYNFDIRNERPLEGRYEWVKLK